MKHQVTKAAMKLLMDGQLFYSKIATHGVRVDKGYLDSAVIKCQEEIDKLAKKLKADPVAKEWKKAYGDKMNFGSRPQLAHVLFDCMGVKEVGEKTKTGRRGTGKNILEKIDLEFVKQYLRIEPLKKSLSTNLVGIRNEMVERDGSYFLHPLNNLNTTVTFRPSSNLTNWRNYPKRNEEIAAMVRPCFIPRPGRQFVEIDYNTLEVRVAGMLTQDKQLQRYILDKTTDMHRDQSVEVFQCKVDQVSKQMRQSVKTYFVFAGFYGSPHYNCAKNLWDQIDRYGLKLADGTPLMEHLKSKGVDRLGTCDPEIPAKIGTFELMVKKAQEKMWERFSGYKQWKYDKINEYHKNGGMVMVTGFPITGSHSRTEIPNYLIQGPAYHCTLWSCIQMQRAMTGMRSLILGDIYDSVQFDMSPKESDDVLNLAKEVMTERLPRAWDWLTLPLETETDVSPINGSWHSCKQWVDDGSGRWSLKV